MKSILTTLADEFEQLASRLNSSPMKIGGFTQACRRVSTLLQLLGPGMWLAAKTEYSAKVSEIENAGNAVNTLEDLLDTEIEQNTITFGGSASLVRVKRSLEMLKIIFEQTIASRENSLVGPVNTAYNQVFAPYHGWEVRGAFELALPLLPTRSQFFEAVNLDEESAVNQMQRTMDALDPLIDYINNLLHSREVALELLNLI